MQESRPRVAHERERYSGRGRNSMNDKLSILGQAFIAIKKQLKSLLYAQLSVLESKAPMAAAACFSRVCGIQRNPSHLRRLYDNHDSKRIFAAKHHKPAQYFDLPANSDHSSYYSPAYTSRPGKII